ncbi:MAG: KilA-N domain-containing protein [Bacteroidales bacterium]
MNDKKDPKATNLQMVNIDQACFAIEAMGKNSSVNLTQMAKPFGVKVAHWLRTDETSSYLAELSKLRKCNLTDLFTLRRGGDNSGTWAHDYRIAMRFAQWLSPKFSLQVDELLVKLVAGQAAIARLKPFNGIAPIFYNGKAWYYYREVLETVGASAGGSASARKARYPEHFLMLNGRNYVALPMCMSLLNQYDAPKFLDYFTEKEAQDGTL